MSSTRYRKGYGLIATVSVLVTGLSAAPAFGDTVGTGNFAIDIDVNAESYSGTLIFDNSPQVVFGTPVNLGTQVDSAGSASISGVVTFNNSTSPVSGTITQDVRANDVRANDEKDDENDDDEKGNTLTFHADGSLVCSPTGCTDGSPGSYVSTVTSISGTVYDSLPLGLSYTTEATFSCCAGQGCVPAVADNIQHCTGPFALNAFEPTNTPVSGGTETLNFTGTFFDPLTGTLRTFDVDVGYHQVASQGETTVAGVSNAAGTLPSNVVLQAGDLVALFIDVSTTAAPVGNISVCIHYTDADNDGLVDGTTVHATALRVLHREGNPPQLVDRTSQLDTVNHEVCATVSSLSPFVLSVGIVGYVPDAVSLKNENYGSKSMGKLGSAIVQCYAKAAKSPAVVLSDCTSGAQGKWTQAVGKFTVPCLRTNSAALGSTAQATGATAGQQLFLCSSPPPPLTCASLAAKNLTKLVTAMVGCNTRAATAAAAGTIRKIASECQFSVLTSFETANSKLPSACQSSCTWANLDAVRDRVTDAIEGTGPQVYCTGATPPVPFGF